MRRFLTLLALCAALPAQIVHLGNYSPLAYDGWVRCTIDRPVPHEAGVVHKDASPSSQVCHYVLGRPIGRDARVIDVRAHLEPGEIVRLDLRTAEPWAFVVPPLPADIMTFFGDPSIGRQRFAFVAAAVDGAAYTCHLRAKAGPMLWADLWTRWYGDTPAFAFGELVVTASNPSVPQVTTTVPTTDFALRFGPANCMIAGAAANEPVLPLGEQMGDGQARSFPLVLVWTNHLKIGQDWSSAGAASSFGLTAIGLAQLYESGNPFDTPNEDALRWTRENFAGEMARLHSWQQSNVSVAARSMNTGAQADQVWVGSECMHGPASLGSELVRYFAALGQSRRPCHHLEANGEQLGLGHANLVMWTSRPHYATWTTPGDAVGTDRLGKVRAITELDTHGWFGPDREHLLCGTLALAARLNGSPALQWQLRANAINWLYGETVDPRRSTSGPDAVRAIGYAGVFAALCDWAMEDRQLAAAVVERWHDRCTRVYRPILEPISVWQVIDDNRVASETGRPWNAMAYQNAAGAGMAYWACKQIGPPEALELFGRQAAKAMEIGYDANRTEWDFVAIDQETGVVGPYVEGQGAHRTGWFAYDWYAAGVWAAHDFEPQNEAAAAVWARMMPSGTRWCPPVRPAPVEGR